MSGVTFALYEITRMIYDCLFTVYGTDYVHTIHSTSILLLYTIAHPRTCIHIDHDACL